MNNELLPINTKEELEKACAELMTLRSINDFWVIYRKIDSDNSWSVHTPLAFYNNIRCFYRYYELYRKEFGGDYSLYLGLGQFDD